MRRTLAILLVTLTGCAATLEHPITHQRMTCQSGWALGGGTGVIGAMMLGLALVGDALFVTEYHQCMDRLKQAGYEEVRPPYPVPAPEAAVPREPG